MLSSQRRLKLQESIGDISEKLIEENLKSKPLMKVTGTCSCGFFYCEALTTFINHNSDMMSYNRQTIYYSIYMLHTWALQCYVTMSMSEF